MIGFSSNLLYQKSGLAPFLSAKLVIGFSSNLLYQKSGLAPFLSAKLLSFKVHWHFPCGKFQFITIVSGAHHLRLRP